MTDADAPLGEFWSLEANEVQARLGTSPRGLSAVEAAVRLREHGPNRIKPRARTDTLALLAAQFKSPIILILIFAAVLSILTGDRTDAVIILVIILASGLLGFWQERGASDAVRKLLSLVQVKATVLRDGRPSEIPVEDVVPGDVVSVGAGDIIPGDCLLLEAKDLFVDEAALTGETFPVEKAPGALAPATPLARRANTLFMGTHVVSGRGTAVVVATGRATEFGHLRAAEAPPARDRVRARHPAVRLPPHGGHAAPDDRHLRHQRLLQASGPRLVPLLAGAGGRPDPQLLPAIISINLAHGAKRMARDKVIVKRLASIENFGSMNVLCSDKTGTLTEGMVRRPLRARHRRPGERARAPLRLSSTPPSRPASSNPIDEAIRERRAFDLSGCRKLDEVPYDFIRKRLSVLVDGRRPAPDDHQGRAGERARGLAPAETAGGRGRRHRRRSASDIERRFEAASDAGLPHAGRRLPRHGPAPRRSRRDDEADMIFLGLPRPLRPAQAGHRRDARPSSSDSASR